MRVAAVAQYVLRDAVGPCYYAAVLRRAFFRIFSRVLRLFYATPVARLIWRFPGSRRLYRFLISLKPSVVTVLGHQIQLDDQDSLLLSVNGIYEALETRLFEDGLRPGDVVVDVGAHIGYYSLLAARTVGPEGHVFAFEPEPRNFELLRTNISTNGYTNVSCLNMAVSDHSGQQALFISSDNTGDHHLYSDCEERMSHTVDVVSLDDFFGEDLKNVAVIKADVQGMELRVLHGMRRLLDANPDLLMFTELSPDDLSSAGSSAEEFLSALEVAGFDLYEIDESHGTVTPISADRFANMSELFKTDDHINLMCDRGAAVKARLQGAPSLETAAT
jgi:FkbM family methyltransferase